MKLELTQRLQQQQILAPQMILSMDVLLLTALQLEQKIEMEFAENPALELVEPTGETKAMEPSPAAPETREFGKLAEFESHERFRSFEVLPRRSKDSSDGDKQAMLQNTAGKPPGLRDFLRQQIRLGTLEARIRSVAEEIVENLDHRGYLSGTPDEVYRSLGQPCSPGEFEHALKAVRSLDPAGVGAEDLRGCLLLQLERDRQEYPLETEIILHHLEDLGQNRIPKIAKDLDATVEDIKDAIEIIAALDPLPGTRYESEPTIYIRPEVVVEKVEGRLEVRIDDGSLPQLTVSESCKEALKESRGDPAVSSFLRKKIESAQWLIHAIHQRQRTLHDIALALVEYQRDFMENGPQRLRALRMQTIADIVRVHISTISRAIKGKYMQTPWGVYEMRFFFTGGVSKADGEVESRRNVYRLIGEIIQTEDKRHPHSDSDIARILKERGLDIARRTVTKYREQERIPSSRLRRSY